MDMFFFCDQPLNGSENKPPLLPTSFPLYAFEVASYFIIVKNDKIFFSFLSFSSFFLFFFFLIFFFFFIFQ